VNNLPDQAEIRANLHVLRLQARHLAAVIETKTGEAVVAPTLAEGDDVANYETMTEHVALLQKKAGQLPATAAIPTKPAQASDPTKQASPKKSADEQIAAALAPTRARRQRQAQLHAQLWPEYKAGRLSMDDLCKRINAVQ
jgi:hypothetical protein